MNDHGFIALGKFSSARDSILHYLCTVGWANDSFGTVEAPTGYVWKISNDPADVHLPNTEITSVLEDWFVQNPEVTDSAELRRELEGHYLVREDDRGFVGVEKFDRQSDRDNAFLRLSNAFDEWEDEAPKMGDYFS